MNHVMDCESKRKRVDKTLFEVSLYVYECALEILCSNHSGSVQHASIFFIVRFRLVISFKALFVGSSILSTPDFIA